MECLVTWFCLQVCQPSSWEELQCVWSSHVRYVLWFFQLFFDLLWSVVVLHSFVVLFIVMWRLVLISRQCALRVFILYNSGEHRTNPLFNGLDLSWAKDWVGALERSGNNCLFPEALLNDTKTQIRLFWACCCGGMLIQSITTNALPSLNLWLIRIFQVYYILCHVNVSNGNLCWCVGECLSGIKAGDTYSMYGASEQCIDTHQQQCGVSSVGECAGDQNSSYVYRIIISQGWLMLISNYFS